uniref:Uncharacterized protein n=1 Tax=Romanomermis culicivorax TaxID=13658 RepID=A0A915IAS3_ROMCU
MTQTNWFLNFRLSSRTCGKHNYRINARNLASEQRLDQHRWIPPPLLDNDGNPVKGQWVWIGEDDDDRLSDTPASSTTSGQKSTTFLDIVAKRMNQTTPTPVNKRVKQ